MQRACQPNLQPTLVGETILIRPLRTEDWHEMFAAASDPLIWELHPARDRYTEQRSEIEIGWTFLVRKHWGGTTNREVKRLMLDHAFTFVDTVVFWVGEANWRSQRAMEKIGAIRRDGLAYRSPTGGGHVVFEITRKIHAFNSRVLNISKLSE